MVSEQRVANGNPLGGLTHRRCPLCGERTRDPVSRVASSPPAEALDGSQLRDRWSGFFQDGHVFFSFERCTGCGLLYCPQYLSPEGLAGMYASMPDNTAGVTVSLLRRTQRGYLRELARLSPLKGTYLELGPDIGIFTERAIGEGNFEQLLLCEPNVEVHDRLKSLVGSRGRIATRLSDAQLLGSGTLVDVVVMIHVLDHLLDPLAILTDLRGRCNPGATLLLVTHDEGSLPARVLGRRWPAYCLQHPQLFSPTTIRSMLSKAGFNVVTTTKSVNYFPVGFLLRHLFHAVGVSTRYLPARGPAIPLKLGNIITVAKPRLGSR